MSTSTPPALYRTNVATLLRQFHNEQRAAMGTRSADAVDAWEESAAALARMWRAAVMAADAAGAPVERPELDVTVTRAGGITLLDHPEHRFMVGAPLDHVTGGLVTIAHDTSDADKENSVRIHHTDLIPLIAALAYAAAGVATAEGDGDALDNLADNLAALAGRIRDHD